MDGRPAGVDHRIAALALTATLVAGMLVAGGAEAKAKSDSLTAEVFPGGKRVAATVETGSQPVRLVVKLNGQDIGALFEYRPAAAGRLVLGAHDGLQRGKNRLRVKALFASGKTREVKRTFQVDGDRPIASAGEDLEVYGGDRVRLTGLKSKPRRPGAKAAQGPLRFNWKIVAKPPGAKPKLRKASSGRPALTTDQPGVYLVRARVGFGQGPARDDVVQINASDPEVTRAGVFVSTTPFGPGAPNGPASGIQIASGSQEGFYTIGDNNPKGQVLTFIFDRATLGLTTNGPVATGVSAADASKLQGLYNNAIADSGGLAPLVISAGNGYGQMSSQFNDWLTQTLNAHGLGGSPSSFALAGTGPVQPTPGPAGTGMHMVNGDVWAAGRLSGQILPDAEYNWAFVPSSLPATGESTVRFDTAAPSGGIELAGQTFPVAPKPAGCPDAGGFQVLVVGAEPPDLLTPIPGPNNGGTFWTNACANGPNTAEEESQTQLAAMLALLNIVEVANGAYPTLIFIQSVGNVSPTTTNAVGCPDNCDVRVIDIATRIQAMGGSSGTFVNLFGIQPTTGYSFIGQSFANYDAGAPLSSAEVATNAPTTPPARLIGAMRQDPQGRFLPTIATAGQGNRAAEFTQPLSQIEIVKELDTSTYQPTPFPNAGNPAWQAALQDIAKAIGLTYNPAENVACYQPPDSKADVRSSYCGGVPDGENADTYWTIELLPQVNAAEYVANDAYDETVWNDVKTQLAIEFGLVDKANASVRVLVKGFTATQAADTGSIVNTYVSDVKKAAQTAALEAEPASIGWLADGLDLAAALTGFFEEDLLSGVLWTFSASTGLSGDLVNDGTGNSLATGLTGSLSGTPQQAANSVEQQTLNQINAMNAARYAIADAIVSDWARLQQAPQDFANLPDDEVVANSVDAFRFASIQYTWKEMLNATATISNLNASGLNVYNPPNLSDPSGYDPSFVDTFECWLSGTGIFHDGESAEKVFQGVTPAAVYTSPYNRITASFYNIWTPSVVTVLGKNPSGNQANPPPEPAEPYYHGYAPNAVLAGFFAAQPAPGSTLTAVVNGGPPGFGIDSVRFFDRLTITAGVNVTCNTNN